MKSKLLNRTIMIILLPIILLLAQNSHACDTWVALKNATKNGNVILAKNSDRTQFDSQPLMFYPRTTWLKGSEIDFVSELMGSSFKISNPKTKSSCGCGISFSI